MIMPWYLNTILSIKTDHIDFELQNELMWNYVFLFCNNLIP